MQCTVSFVTTAPNDTILMTRQALQQLVDEAGEAFLKVHPALLGEEEALQSTPASSDVEDQSRLQTDRRVQLIVRAGSSRRQNHASAYVPIRAHFTGRAYMGMYGQTWLAMTTLSTYSMYERLTSFRLWMTSVVRSLMRQVACLCLPRPHARRVLCCA
jgi:hypothetical protein